LKKLEDMSVYETGDSTIKKDGYQSAESSRSKKSLKARKEAYPV